MLGKGVTEACWSSINRRRRTQSSFHRSGRPYGLVGSFVNKPTNTVTNVLDRTNTDMEEEQAPAAMEEDQPVSCEF